MVRITSSLLLVAACLSMLHSNASVQGSAIPGVPNLEKRGGGTEFCPSAWQPGSSCAQAFWFCAPRHTDAPRCDASIRACGKDQQACRCDTPKGVLHDDECVKNAGNAKTAAVTACNNDEDFKNCRHALEEYGMALSHCHC